MKRASYASRKARREKKRRHRHLVRKYEAWDRIHLEHVMNDPQRRLSEALCASMVLAAKRSKAEYIPDWIDDGERVWDLTQYKALTPRQLVELLSSAS